MEGNNPTVSTSTEASKCPSRSRPFWNRLRSYPREHGITGVLVDEAGALYRRSVERGGSTVLHVRTRLPHPHRPHRRSARPAGKRGRHSHQASDAYEAVMTRLNLPTEADLEQRVDPANCRVGGQDRPIRPLTKRGGNNIAVETSEARSLPGFSAPSASPRCFRTRTAIGYPATD